MRLLRIISALFTAAALTGCNSGGCLDNQSALPLAEVLDSTTGAALTMRGVEIWGVGSPGDSLLLGADEALSKVYLPMRSTAESVSWCFHYASPFDSPAMNDTVTFAYSSEPFFASDECGAFFQYRINTCRYTTHLMDSVVVADSLITNVELTRIKIYYNPEKLNPETPGEPENPDDAGEPDSGEEAAEL